jgi:hypothetical protein
MRLLNIMPVKPEMEVSDEAYSNPTPIGRVQTYCELSCFTWELIRKEKSFRKSRVGYSCVASVFVSNSAISQRGDHSPPIYIQKDTQANSKSAICLEANRPVIASASKRCHADPVQKGK